MPSANIADGHERDDPYGGPPGRPRAAPVARPGRRSARCRPRRPRPPWSAAPGPARARSPFPKSRIRFFAEKLGAVKILAGHQSFKEEVARIEAVRRALGNDVRLMVDCARRLTPSAAVRFARAIRDFDIYWLEDPVPQVDIAGQLQVGSRARRHSDFYRRATSASPNFNHCCPPARWIT